MTGDATGRDMTTSLIDLTRPLTHSMPVYPGDPAVTFARAVVQSPWRVTQLGLGTHSGTHVDAPAHYVPEGRTIDDYPLERFVLEAYVVRVDAEEGQALDWTLISQQLPAHLSGFGVLLNTGWDRHWGSDVALRHPFLSPDAARRLASSGATLVGTDAFSVDASQYPTTHAHHVLLGRDVLIVENLTGLAALAVGRAYRCAFVPLSLTGGDGSPIRAYAWVS